MNINATLFGQFITFAIFIWFTMRYVWPPITHAMRDRANKIAEALAAAEKSKYEVEVAENQARMILREAKQEAAHIIEQAHVQAGKLIEEGKTQAKKES